MRVHWHQAKFTGEYIKPTMFITSVKLIAVTFRNFDIIIQIIFLSIKIMKQMVIDNIPKGMFLSFSRWDRAKYKSFLRRIVINISFCISNFIDYSVLFIK